MYLEFLAGVTGVSSLSAGEVERGVALGVRRYSNCFVASSTAADGQRPQLIAFKTSIRATTCVQGGSR